MQRRTPSRVAARLPARNPAASASVELSDSSDDAMDLPRANWKRAPQGRVGTGISQGSSSAYSSRHEEPSSSELSNSDDGASYHGGRKAPKYKTPSRGSRGAVRSPDRTAGDSRPQLTREEARPRTGGLNRGLGGSGAGDDIEMIEQSIGRQQHGIVKAGHNAVNRAINAARSHNQQQYESEISASSEDEHHVPHFVPRASMAALERSQVYLAEI